MAQDSKVSTCSLQPRLARSISDLVLQQELEPSAGTPKACGPDGTCLDNEQVGDTLDWTITPKTSLIKEGNSRCFITMPKQKSGNGRIHPLHLMREVDIEPGKVDDLQVQDFACPIVKVHGWDLRRCGTDLEMLRKCALPPVQTETKHKLHEKGNIKSKSLSSLRRPLKVSDNYRGQARLRETEDSQSAYIRERLARAASMPKTGSLSSQDRLSVVKSASSLHALRHETAFPSNGTSKNLRLSHPRAPQSPSKTALDALLNASRQAARLPSISSNSPLPFLMIDALSETLNPPKPSKSSSSRTTMP